jgi:hypothetical protein
LVRSFSFAEEYRWKRMAESGLCLIVFWRGEKRAAKLFEVCGGRNFIGEKAGVSWGRSGKEFRGLVFGNRIAGAWGETGIG